MSVGGVRVRVLRLPRHLPCEVHKAPATKSARRGWQRDFLFPGILFRFFPVIVFAFFFWECFRNIRSSRKVRGRSSNSRASGRERERERERESEAVTQRRRSRSVEIVGTSLRLSLGFSGFGFLWARFLVFRVSLGTSVKSSSAFCAKYTVR